LGIRVENNPGNHVPKAEALIKHVKGYCRGVISTLPWDLPSGLVPDLIAYAVQRMNLLENKEAIPGLPPVVLFTGVPLNLQREARFPFGQYVHAVRPNLPFKNDVLTPRTEEAIVVGQHGRTGALKIRLINNKNRSRVIRTKVLPMPVSSTVIKKMNNWAKEKPPVMDAPAEEQSHLEDDVQAPPLHEPPHVEDVIRDKPQLLVGTQELNAPDHPSVMEQAPQPEEVAEEPLEPANLLGESVLEEPQREGETDPNPILMGVRRSQRAVPSRDYKRLSAYGFAVMKLHAKSYHMSSKKALSIHGDAATQAAAKELKQMVDKDVFIGVDWDRMSSAERAIAIRSFMFFKEKPDKLKARLVADGAQQDELLYEDTTSPTASFFFKLMRFNYNGTQRKKTTSPGALQQGYSWLWTEEIHILSNSSPRAGGRSR
jgi:hypothetical protein